MSKDSSDSFLDDPLMVSDPLDLDLGIDLIPTVQVPVSLAEGEIDPRLKLLSHSSRTLLHTCPRKYQLYRLNTDLRRVQQSSRLPDEEEETSTSVTFAFGTAVGVGVQSALESKSFNQVMLDTFLSWKPDLLAENTKQKKSFFLAFYAIQKFMQMQEAGYLDDYDLVYFKDAEGVSQPAIELSFQILMPDGFKYRGFVDAILIHKVTKEIMVLECKTTAGTANAAMYKNSGQALGYSVILDQLFPNLSSYEVLYLVYESKKYEYVQLPFEKSLMQRALWLQELVIEAEKIKLYAEYNVFPQHGENCFDFYRECEYLGICTMQTAYLAKPLTEEILEEVQKDEERYSFTISFEDLVATQIKKGEM